MKKLLFKIIFNIIETIIIFNIGLIFKLDYSLIICLMLIFFFTRMLCGLPKHYNKWYNCFIWSTLTFTSVYATTDLDLLANILLTIFAGYIATGRADIGALYQWSGKSSNYDALKDLISMSPNNKILLEHEEYWRNNYFMRYEIFRLYFRERYSYTDIIKIKNLPDSTIIKRECQIIYAILEKPLGLPSIKTKQKHIEASDADL